MYGVASHYILQNTILATVPAINRQQKSRNIVYIFLAVGLVIAVDLVAAAVALTAAIRVTVAAEVEVEVAVVVQ